MTYLHEEKKNAGSFLSSGKNSMMGTMLIKLHDRRVSGLT